MSWWNIFAGRPKKAKQPERIKSTTQPDWVSQNAPFRSQDWTGKRYEEWEAARNRIWRAEERAFGAMNRKRWKQAEQYLQEVMAIADPEGVRVARANLVRVYEQSGQIDRAISNYEQWTREQFQVDAAFTRLAIIFKKRKEYDRVIGICQQAIAYYRNTGNADMMAQFQKRLAEAERRVRNQQE